MKLANNRRTQWASVEEAETYFTGKGLFRNFDPDCLKDYVQYGTTPYDGGVKLSFDVNVESEIFKTTPDNISCLRKRLTVPGVLVTAHNTDMIRRYMAWHFAKRQGLYLEQAKDGSHLFPLEYPERAADLIKEAIVELETKRDRNH